MQWVLHTVVTVPVFMLIVAAALYVRRPPPLAASPHPPEHPRNAWHQYYARYAVLILAFVVFDMEMAFMYPWAVAFKRTGLTGFVDMLIFVAILACALWYLWRTRAIDLE